IVIDDMGIDRKRSARAVDLPSSVTLAYLPYSPDIKSQTEKAKAQGHELIVHMPMQPQRNTANPGPDYLGGDVEESALRERLVRNLSAFEGYVGINNHMGSKFTRNSTGMKIVMDELKARGLLFLDSK